MSSRVQQRATVFFEAMRSPVRLTSSPTPNKTIHIAIQFVTTQSIKLQQDTKYSQLYNVL